MAALTSDADPRKVREFTSLARMIYDVSGCDAHIATGEVRNGNDVASQLRYDYKIKECRVWLVSACQYGHSGSDKQHFKWLDQVPFLVGPLEVFETIFALGSQHFVKHEPITQYNYHCRGLTRKKAFKDEKVGLAMRGIWESPARRAGLNFWAAVRKVLESLGCDTFYLRHKHYMKIIKGLPKLIENLFKENNPIRLRPCS